MRLDEVSELADREEELRGLRVDDVLIRPAEDEGGRVVGWVSVVMLARPRAHHSVPWMLGLRPTEAEARAATVTLLKGLLKGQKKAKRDHPGSTDVNVEADRRLVLNVVTEIEKEWRVGRLPDLGEHPRYGKEKARGVPSVPMTAALTAWATQVRATRTRWGWTQVVLAEKVGVPPGRISQFEQGHIGFPDEVLARLAEVLDLEPPAET